MTETSIDTEHDAPKLFRVVGAAVAAALVLAPFVFLGVVNADEGWYAVSSRLAARGRLPFRDFAFTQGPVYLYLLAPFERLVPGLVTARVVSAVCAAVGIGLVLVVADRLGGRWAVLFSGATLLASTPSLPYWLALTKTYGVSSLFLAATLYALTSRSSPSRRLPAATVCAFLFSFTRPSAVAFALTLLIVTVWIAPSVRSRLTIAGVAALSALPFLILVALAPDAAVWGLFRYHGLSTLPRKTLGAKLFGRSFDVMRAWPGPTLLVVLAVIALATSAATRRRLRDRPELVAVVAGLVSFLVLHELGTWFWAEEYVAPILPAVIVLAVSTLVVFGDELGSTAVARHRSQRRTTRAKSKSKAKAKARSSRRPAFTASRIERWHVTVALVVCVGVTVVTGGHEGYIGTPGWRGAPSANRVLARCIERNSASNDRVFALYYAELVAESDRTPVDGASLGIFSYEDVSPRRAHDLHILDASRVLDIVSKQLPKVVVFSGIEAETFSRAGYFSTRRVDANPIADAIDKNYRVACRKSVTRQVPNSTAQVVILVRKR